MYQDFFSALMRVDGRRLLCSANRRIYGALNFAAARQADKIVPRQKERSQQAEPTVLSPTDTGLVSDIRNGREQAEAALYEKYSAKVFYLALRESKSRQDAEDVRAETFLRVIQAIRGNQIRLAEALPAFILGVTRNVLRELFVRRSRAGNDVSADEANLVTPSHEGLFLDQEAQLAVKRTIEKLKSHERTILRMCFYEELPTDEIARRTGIAPERVRLVKSRALKRFRDVHIRISMSRGKNS